MQVEIKAQEDENFKFNHDKLTASEAVYGFTAWLTTRDEITTMGSSQECSNIAKLCEQFVTENNLDKPRDGWENNLIHPSGECSHGNIDDSHVNSAIPEPIVETPVQPEPPKRREATLNNPSGHEWFNGTSWGVK
jgi:hypothetical protein